MSACSGAASRVPQRATHGKRVVWVAYRCAGRRWLYLKLPGKIGWHHARWIGLHNDACMLQRPRYETRTGLLTVKPEVELAARQQRERDAHECQPAKPLPQAPLCRLGGVRSRLVGHLDAHQIILQRPRIS